VVGNTAIAEPSWDLHIAENILTVEIELPLVSKAGQIDAYAENGALEVEVEGLYRLRVELPCAIEEAELGCRFKKKEKKLIVTVPIVRAPQAEPQRTPEEKSTPPVAANPAEEERTPEANQSQETLPSSHDSLKRIDEAEHQGGTAQTWALGTEVTEEVSALAADDSWIPNRVELQPQEGIEGLVIETEKVANTTIVNGVSNFSIFKHNLGKEFDEIYAATRANLPSIQADEEDDEDDGEEVEIVDATAKLEALTKRTYAMVEAKGLRLTGGEELEAVEAC